MVIILLAELMQPPKVTLYVIIAVPADIPTISPVIDPANAIDGTELVHVPPPVVAVQVVVEPIQIGVVPLIVCAIGAETETVFDAVFKHPPTVTLYVINEVPALTPETIPFEVPIVAIDISELVHVPPGVVDNQV